MIVDLVSPWSAAIDAADSPRAQGAYRARHARLLEDLRLQRAPLASALPLATESRPLRRLAGRAADPGDQRVLRAALNRAGELGADACSRLILLAGDGPGAALEPLPWPDGEAVLFLDRTTDESDTVAAIGGVAALTRWRAPDSQSPVRRLAGARWNRWQAAREFPLREWVYAAGINLHLASALRPDQSPHRLLGMGQAAFTRLRERERALQELLAADLDRPGIEHLLRWLAPDAPVEARRIGRTVLPPMAGCYLGWRLLAERVARVGLAAAIRLQA